MAGHFIAFEGGEGTGKSTQARALAQELETRGFRVTLTREPGGTERAEAIRALLLDRDATWSMRAEALLFAAARADHVAKLIVPRIAEGGWVICDRFVASSLAYQAGEDGLEESDIRALHAIGSGGLLPDLTVVMSADTETIAARLRARDGGGSDRIGGRPPAYHSRVAQRFARLAQSEPSRHTMIDAEGSPEAVHERVMAAIEQQFGRLPCL